MKTILIQLDTDTSPSTFDRVVAIDAGVDHLFSYGGIAAENVVGLVHGAIFTRGVPDLKHTAIFVGGSQVSEGERVFDTVQKAFFGPMRVSVMMDSNGCNTTATAAVATARKHLSLAGISAVVLGATGPVGLRVAQLLAMEQARVTLVSRTEDRAAAACQVVRDEEPGASLRPVAAATSESFAAICDQQQLIVAAGAAGISFLPAGGLSRLNGVRLAIDLNAVPPLGIADISAADKAMEKSGVICYGALGVGGLKMKVHRQAVQSLFEDQNRVLACRELYQLAIRIAGV